MTPADLALLGVAVGGWLGGANLVARRMLLRSKGPLGPKHDAWSYRGLLVAPDWLSYSLMAAGAVLVLVAGVWALAA